MGVAERLQTFGMEWVRNPIRVGAILPSGPDLAGAITKGLGPTSGPVLELGPGTGVFTQALLKRGVDPGHITTVELGSGFVETLRLRFPGVRTLQGDATKLGRLLSGQPEQFDNIVCGLPLLSMPKTRVHRILSGSFRRLRKDGTFRLFTYGWRCPIPGAISQRLGLVIKRDGFALNNAPPATVYVVRRLR